MPKHIMVFNDTEEILQLFFDLLTPEGYSVSLHTYSTRDMDDVRRVMPDLIISDHPPFREEEGWQFLQKLRMTPDLAHIPVIVCTTSMKWFTTNVDEGLLVVKRITVLPKPFVVDELLREIHATMGAADDPEPGPILRGVSQGQPVKVEAPARD
jgi:CheY-like chemotaxis protein